MYFYFPGRRRGRDKDRRPTTQGNGGKAFDDRFGAEHGFRRGGAGVDREPDAVKIYIHQVKRIPTKYTGMNSIIIFSSFRYPRTV